jgi:ubiquinone biosynthesis O-methyltransferase
MTLFDNEAENYDLFFGSELGKQVLRYESRAILGSLCLSKGLSILDVGCGTGIFTKLIAQKGLNVTGVDESEKMLSLAKSKPELANVEFVNANAENLSFADAQFDKVLCAFMLEFAKNPLKVVIEMIRVLKPGGTLVIATLNSQGIWAKGRVGEGVYTNAKFRSPSELLSLIPIVGSAITCVHFSPQTKKYFWLAEMLGNIRKSQDGAAVVARFIKQCNGKGVK